MRKRALPGFPLTWRDVDEAESTSEVFPDMKENGKTKKILEYGTKGWNVVDTNMTFAHRHSTLRNCRISAPWGKRSNVRRIEAWGYQSSIERCTLYSTVSWRSVEQVERRMDECEDGGLVDHDVALCPESAVALQHRMRATSGNMAAIDDRVSSLLCQITKQRKRWQC